ncbi:hypothetical protein PVK62_14265 [Aliivibrio sp. S3MY1]|uniref:hypothetical protein n=1 Tax=unclassified Aliivibrio TaxID=2645654 RepID=UPI00237893A2|nr:MULTISPECIES: hypothetical protein [unclassified Aliivibrio]MDD9196988.1 hypothetical protein [Aliivibrio sp. S3MY1]MDD9198098.1 hypothetical protein [Aliivibrio sp. S2MY1]
MFSQSIFAQLVRMSVLLVLSLIAVHNSPTLLNLLAQQAVNSGCHQQTGQDDNHHHSHHHH